MGVLFDHYNAEVVKCKDITLGNIFPEIFISESDEIFCYLDICMRNKENAASLFTQPYYILGKHSTDDEIIEKITKFYRIIEGCIVLDNYIDNKYYSDRLYKKLNCRIHFPHPDNYYAVWINQQEDENLTRAIFGLTHKEITELLNAYAKTMGTYSEYITYPKLTKSQKNTNCCDLTGAWIPKGFPYITFKDIGFDFSHISLLGFYRHIQLLTGYNIKSVFSKALIKSGADEQILERVFNMDICNLYQTKVTKEILEHY